MTATKSTAAKTGRNRKTAETVTVSPKEAALRQKYEGTHTIVPGSLRAAGGRDGWGHKHTVEVACRHPGCTTGRRVVATSDLQFPGTAYCPVHAVLFGAARRKRLRQQAKARTTTAG